MYALERRMEALVEFLLDLDSEERLAYVEIKVHFIYAFIACCFVCSVKPDVNVLLECVPLDSMRSIQFVTIALFNAHHKLFATCRPIAVA